MTALLFLFLEFSHMYQNQHVYFHIYATDLLKHYLQLISNFADTITPKWRIMPI